MKGLKLRGLGLKVRGKYHLLSIGGGIYGARCRIGGFRVNMMYFAQGSGSQVEAWRPRAKRTYFV